MRSSLTILGLLLCLLPTLASASALKGVRGTRRLQLESESPSPKEPKDPKEKKCKKYAEPKADPKVAPETKATASDPMATDAEPKEAVAPKDPKDPKAAPESKATAGDPKDPKAKKADPKAAAQECLEWEESSDVVSDPSFGSTSTEFQSVNVDCEAIATDKGPTDTHSVSFMVNMDVLKDADTSLKSIYSAMEKELQSKIAPRIAGCSGSRMLAEESSKIVYVDFGEMDLDNKGCDSSLAKEAESRDGVCTSTDFPVDVYFVGDFPDSAIAKVEVAIEQHQWDVDGLLDTSEVAIIQTRSTMGSGKSGSDMSPGVYAGIAIAVVVAALLAFCCYKRRQATPVAKAELDTDEESDDDKDKHKSKVTQVEAKPVGRW